MEEEVIESANNLEVADQEETVESTATNEVVENTEETQEQTTTETAEETQPETKETQSAEDNSKYRLARIKAEKEAEKKIEQARKEAYEQGLQQGKVQSYNKDSKLKNGLDEVERLYLDLFGVPGNSGSGIINKENGRIVGIFAGSSIDRSVSMTFELNYAIPVSYLWNLIESLENKKE